MEKPKINNNELESIADILEKHDMQDLAETVRKYMNSFWGVIRTKNRCSTFFVDTENQFDKLILKLASYYYRMYGKLPDWSFDNKGEDIIKCIKEDSELFYDFEAGDLILPFTQRNKND